MRARIESFGAWVQIDDRALVAVDRELAAKLGLEGGEAWQGAASIASDPSAPLEVHVAITARCPATCSGCYVDARAEGEHRPFDDLARTLDEIASRGVFTVAFGGGEPLGHPDLERLGAHARSLGLVPVFTTSGFGLTPERARSLGVFAQVNVSHDGVDDAYAAVRGFDGARVAERAIATLVEAGVPVGVNLVLTRTSFASLHRTARHVAALGARELQLLRYKPAGRAASLEYLDKRLTIAQIRELPARLTEIVDEGVLSMRIDCAMLPFLSTALSDVTSLLSLGVMGCEAGRALAAVDVRGRSVPCSFAHGEAVDAFRAYPARAPEPCASCPIRAVCRGGCRVVAKHVASDPFMPDPECPRVVEHRARST